MSLLEVAGLCKRFGGVIAAEALDLTVAAGEIHAVIGPNGAGKTTLLAQIAGETVPDAGMIRLAGRDMTGLGPAMRAGLGIGRSFQQLNLFEDLTVDDQLALALQAAGPAPVALKRPLPAASAAAGLRAHLGLEGLGARPAKALSHGERRRLDLALALAGRPRLLLLDEPMAGLGAEEAAPMAALIAGLRQAAGAPGLLLVEHDMDVVFRLADRITVMVEGRVLASGRPDVIRADARAQAAYLGEAG